MRWKLSIAISAIMFFGAFVHGFFYQNLAAMLSGCVASAGFWLLSVEERRFDALAQLREGK